jgi:hypothetical protein
MRTYAAINDDQVALRQSLKLTQTQTTMGDKYNE